ncbi:hypothetical protein B0T26DRAFT_671621 [Lasiosphaeria miniovina]|uniref:Uncharacterized protein n=1 Tax=Lasiosphaeria miniovina TaxID=1954250 RepID=A0AA40B386_9PEZI|nr:uncharacterized protein B0T26DRAFT_671621 [Lasiosphaeria miniovina]KAK0726880.1 hypothetical protein B0T26DRAFT_671621 [Lasiosphaeria miniovina]
MASITSRSTTSPSVSASSAIPSVSTVPTSVRPTKDSDPPAVRFTKTHFTKIDRAREKQGRKFRFRDYDSNSRIFIITITTRGRKKRLLSFRLLFLRDPGPGEEDFIFSVQELERYAENIWLQV